VSEEESLRWSIVEACRNMRGLGLNQGTAGNISLRWQDGLLITPSGMAYEEMQAEDIVFMTPDGRFAQGQLPSSEWRIHCDILSARPDVQAIIHAHPLYSTAFAICRETIPAVHYMIAAAGGPTIRCSDYATFGTQELSEMALLALQDRNCCLLANHGILATGASLAKAMWLAVELETLCHQYAIARQIGTPRVLSDAEIAVNIEKFRTYGLRERS